jgi:methylthioribose-1-phosphate isomerase
MNLPSALLWEGTADGQLVLLDQTRLPLATDTRTCRDVHSVWEAIRQLAVRGAPAIGIAAAYGVVLAVGKPAAAGVSAGELLRIVEEAADFLSTSRPTAVNLFWALNRMRNVASKLVTTSTSGVQLSEMLLEEARRIHDEDRRMCQQIGSHGARLLADCRGVLTHCNAGALATGGAGTALAPIYALQEMGRSLKVYADETRPLLQGARLTAWELATAGVEVTVICDNMAADVMRAGWVQAVIVGADRITARGDVANKIGTYAVAILARYHNIPFYVAAPSSTFDLSLISGQDIPIEQRAAQEVTSFGAQQTVPSQALVYNPAFDVTPAELVSAIITERGVIEPVCEVTVRTLLEIPAASLIAANPKLSGRQL